MSDITVTFKNQTILTMDASGSKDLLTQGKYCEDDITISYVKPSGGGGDLPSNWTVYDVTATSVATNAQTALNIILAGITRANNHVYNVFLKNKARANWVANQLIEAIVAGTSSNIGYGIRFRNDELAGMAGISSSFDATVEIGDEFVVIDVDYTT